MTYDLCSGTQTPDPCAEPVRYRPALTRRERKEWRLARRLEWAESREKQAISAGLGARAFEHAGMAEHHRSRAEGIQHQLDHSIFSDDPDAPERLRERIEKLEAKREFQKACNAAYRKGGVAGLRGFAGEKVVAAFENLVRLCSWERMPFPSYSMTNLSANIRRLKNRLAAIEGGTR
jgi:hypothetical protein